MAAAVAAARSRAEAKRRRLRRRRRRRRRRGRVPPLRATFYAPPRPARHCEPISTLLLQIIIITNTIIRFGLHFHSLTRSLSLSLFTYARVYYKRIYSSFVRV